MGKTPEYTLKAARSYREKFDFLNIRLEKGMKARADAVGLDNRSIAALIASEIEKREAAGTDRADGVPFLDD